MVDIVGMILWLLPEAVTPLKLINETGIRISP